MVKSGKSQQPDANPNNDISDHVGHIWARIRDSEEVSKLKEILDPEKLGRIRSHIELYLKSEGLKGFVFGLENQAFVETLRAHLSSPATRKVFFIDILGAQAWVNPQFHSYVYEQMALYMYRNKTNRWNLTLTDDGIRKTIERRLASVDIDEVMPDFDSGDAIDLHIARILSWDDEDMKSDVAHDLIELHKTFNIPLFYYPRKSWELLLLPRKSVEFHVALDEQDEVLSKGCWIYAELNGRQPYEDHKPQLSQHPIDYIRHVLQQDECQFAIERRNELIGGPPKKRRVMFVNSPTEDKGGFRGSPTSLLYTLGPLVEEIKRKRIALAGFSHVNLFDPIYYTDSVREELDRRLSSLDPDIVGISSTSDSFHIADKIAKQIKDDPKNRIVILGGPHCDEVDFSATLNPNNPIESSRSFDFAIVGDGEYMLLELTKTIIEGMEKSNPEDLDNIKRYVSENSSGFSVVPGMAKLYFKVGGETKEIRSSWQPLDLNVVPPLRYEYLQKAHLQDFDIFKDEKGQIMNCVQVLTHRGCQGGCSFCSEKVLCYEQRGYYNTTKRVETVINEMEHYIRRVGAQAFFFDDSTFMEDSQFVSNLCTEIDNRGLSRKIKWGCLNRFDKVDNTQLVQDMVRAGLDYMYLGLELFDDSALGRMIKHESCEHVLQALEMLKDNKVRVGVSVLLGLPDESEEIEKATIRFVGQMVEENKISLLSLSLFNYHLASSLRESHHKQSSLDYHNPGAEVIDRQNRPPWNVFEEGGWWHAFDRRRIGEDYLTRLLWEVNTHIKDKSVLVRRKELEEFISSSWNRKAIEASEALSLVSQTTKVTLSQVRVVGNYMRFNDESRRHLKDVRARILKGLDKSAARREHFLIWGLPGSGKTKFVREIAREAGLAFKKGYMELDLTRMKNRDDFESRLAELAEESKQPKLCLVDEIDAKPGEAWPYEVLKSYLDDTIERGLTVNFVLVGSWGQSILDLKDHIRSGGSKGKDMLRRLSGNECEIDPMSLGDKMVVFLANIIEVAQEQRKPITEVEQTALFYVLLHPRLESAADLGDFAFMAVARFLDEFARPLRYDDLFDAGDEMRMKFWNDHDQDIVSLKDKYVVVED